MSKNKQNLAGKKIFILLNRLSAGGIATYVSDISVALSKGGYEIAIGVGRYSEVDVRKLFSVYGLVREKRKGRFCREIEIGKICLKIYEVGNLPKNVFSPRIFFCLLKLVRFVKDFNPDIMWAHTRSTSVLSHMVWKLMRIPYIVTYHGFFRPNLGRFLLKAQGLVTIAVSSAVKHHSIRDLKLDEAKVVVIPNAISDVRLRFLEVKVSQSRPVARENLGIPKDVFVAGMLCRINKNKGYHYIFELLEKTDDNVHFLLVGAPSNRYEEKRICTLISNCQHRERLHFVDLSRVEIDIALFWASVDVFLLLSHREGFGFTVLEAMFLGIPVIAFDCGGVLEMIEDGVSGIIVERGDIIGIANGIKKLCNDADFLKKISVSAKRKSQEFSYHYFTQRIEEVILKVAGR